ncbi:MAG: adenylate kinase [Chitinophagales bacterium]|nr:adenylate kinase [Bacteroidota bacterium]MBX7142008.1 adenylate kinase [Chitinophagales bacterium]
MLNIVLFGPPGSGKGTQAVMLKEKYSLFHISTGDIFRREIKGKTELGLEVTGYLDKGLLVPDEVTFKVLATEIRNNMDKIGNGILFDGYPRTTPQAEIMDKFFDERGTPVSMVLSLLVHDEEVVKRILQRGKTSGRSDDNDESIVRERLRVYKEQTLPLADYYRGQGKYVELNGEGSIEEIFGRLCAEIDKVK